jgi:FAD/FMN-containing dehydrogenase
LLNQQAAKLGLCFSSGHCSGVPLGGFLLGGGFGWFSEYYGYAAESVLSVTIVTPQGKVIDACDSDSSDNNNNNNNNNNENHENNDDWLWLARGAASTFPGVAVQLHPVPPIVRNVMGLFPLEDFEKLVNTYFLAGRIILFPARSRRLYSSRKLLLHWRRWW